MTDIKMLPLPEPDNDVAVDGEGNETFFEFFNAEQMREYARAVAEHNVRFLTHELANAECAIDAEQAGRKKAEAEIEALRAEVAAWRELSDHVRAGACNAIWPDRYTDARTRDVAAALKRAERLAEALRGLLALPIAEAELRHLDKGIGTATRNAAWLRARAALRDHDKEGKE